MTRVQAEEILTLLEEWLDLREDVAFAAACSAKLEQVKQEEADEARGLLADKMVEVCS